MKEFHFHPHSFSSEAEKNNYLEQIKYLVEKNVEARKQIRKVMGEICNFKIMETFLEGAPQSILQLYIVIQTNDEIKEVELFTWLTISISILSFTLTSVEIYLEHPTQVFFLTFRYTVKSQF